jgi:GH25 family lysozyme M1 (1,4-beta-N-acetylmuramidase)
VKTTLRSLLALALLSFAGCQAHAGVEPEGDVSTEYLRSTCAEGPTVRGIDVSKWQDAIDWDRVAGSGVRFAFIRVSDGARVHDERFERNWREARRVGLLRGVYQFFRPGQDVAAQANLVIEAIRGDSGELAPVIDVEDTDGRSRAQVAAAVAEWIRLVSAGTGRTPIVYTGPYFWRDQVGNPDQSASPLWIAHYTTGCPLISEDVWPRWTFWQYSSSGRVPGISGNVDMNYFNGTMADLHALASGGGTPAPVPETPPASSGSGELAWPTDTHPITSYVTHSARGSLVRYDCDHITRANHKGTDIGVARRTPVHAALAGTVIRAVDGCTEGNASCGGGFGNHVILQHADGRATLYGHMTNGSVRVHDGAHVDCGQELGLSGSTGHSTGPHLHFEVRDGVRGIGNYYDRTPTDPFGGSCSTQSGDLWGGSCTPSTPRDDSRYMSSTHPRTVTVSPGDTITQAWRLENTGTTTWSSDAGYALVHTTGPNLMALQRIGVSTRIAPHANARFEATFLAPTEPGTYAVAYRMTHGDDLFGQTVSLSIRVAGPMGCHSATLGEDVPSGSCVQVSYAGCGMSRCGWYACSNGSWFCTDPGACSADESHANSVCEPETPPDPTPSSCASLGCGDCTATAGCAFCPGDGQCYADADAGMCSGGTTTTPGACYECHDVGGTCADRFECCGATTNDDIQCIQGFCEDVTMCAMNGDTCVDADPMARCCGTALCGRDTGGSYECCFAPGEACTATSDCCGNEQCEGGHCQAQQIGEPCQNTQECEGSSYCLDDHTCGY